jgi:ARMET, C-terminal
MPPAVSPIDLTAAVAAAASGYASLKVSALKRLLQQRGISFTGCVEKDDLVQRLVDSGGGGGIGGIDTGAPPFDSGSFYSTMKVAEMKRQLQQLGISFADCIEKSDLIKRLESSKDRSTPAVKIMVQRTRVVVHLERRTMLLMVVVAVVVRIHSFLQDTPRSVLLLLQQELPVPPMLAILTATR